MEPGSDYRFKFSANTTPPSSYSSVNWTPDFNVTERRFTVLIKEPIADCNDTVVCGRQPVIQIRNHHPDSDARNLDGVWTVNASILTSSTVDAGGSGPTPPSPILLGNTTLIIDNITGVVMFTDLRISTPARNVTLLFTVTVEPHEHRLANMSATSQPFDVQARLLCLKELRVPVSLQEGQVFTRQPLLHIVDCATGWNAVAIQPINVTASVITNEGHTISGNTTVLSQHHFVVNFTDLALNPWKVNATLLYSSPDLYKNVSALMYN